MCNRIRERLKISSPDAELKLGTGKRKIFFYFRFLSSIWLAAVSDGVEGKISIHMTNMKYETRRNWIVLLRPSCPP